MIKYNGTASLFVSAAKTAEIGDGLSPGHPLASVKGALEKVREIRSAGAKQPLSICFLEGEYLFSENLVIHEDISDVTFQPFGNDKVIITGGVRITGFIETEFNGVKCFSAKADKRLCEKGFSDLYVDGLRADFTRYPREGYLYAEDVEKHSTQLFDGSKWFIAEEGDIPSFDNIEDCFISFNHYWIDEHSPIESYDQESKKVTMRYTSRFSIDGGRDTASGIAYIIENTAENFKYPNEWYFNRKTGTVYYIPRDDSQKPDKINVYAPLTDKLISIIGNGKKAEGIRFKNLIFAYTKGDYASGGDTNGKSDGIRYASDPQAVSNASGIISFENAHSCEVKDCRVANFGLCGIEIKKGCSNIRITGCDIYDGGAGGIKIRGGAAGSGREDKTYNIKVIDNRIEHCGRRYLSACGILIIDASENDIINNDICDLYYTGISCGWVWGYADSATHDNRIEKNHIYNLGQGVLSDMGGVYLLGKQPGTVVSENLIHDIKSRHYGGWALYTDEGSSYITLENNICYNTSDSCFHQHYGSMNTVRNNILAYSGGEIIRITRGEPHLSAIFESNIIISDGVPAYTLAQAHYEDGNAAAHRNVFFDANGIPPCFASHEGKRMNIKEVRETGFETGSAVSEEKVKGLTPAETAGKADISGHGFRIVNTDRIGAKR